MGTRHHFTADWHPIQTPRDLPVQGFDVLLTCDSDDGPYVDEGYLDGEEWAIGFAHVPWNGVRAWMPKPQPWGGKGKR